MIRTRQPVTDAARDTFAAMLAIVSVSAAIGRLLAEDLQRASRIALSRRGLDSVVRSPFGHRLCSAGLDVDRSTTRPTFNRAATASTSR